MPAIRPPFLSASYREVVEAESFFRDATSRAVTPRTRKKRAATRRRPTSGLFLLAIYTGTTGRREARADHQACPDRALDSSPPSDRSAAENATVPTLRRVGRHRFLSASYRHVVEAESFLAARRALDSRARPGRMKGRRPRANSSAAGSTKPWQQPELLARRTILPGRSHVTCGH
jgi:hypothetical protein